MHNNRKMYRIFQNNSNNYNIIRYQKNKKQPQKKQALAMDRAQQAATTQLSGDSRTALDKNQQKIFPECTILDPNYTYANTRTTPNGSIVGPLANGTRVQVIGELNDPSGRPWSEVKFGNAGTTGYVFKRLLTSCK